MKIIGYSCLFLLLLFFQNGCSSKGKAKVISVSNKREEFGKKLFFDKRLSKDNSISCASCHLPELAFTDGKKKSIGLNGSSALRNSPSLLNVKDATSFMYDGAVKTLEIQAIIPIQDLNEMGITMRSLIDKLNAIPEYRKRSLDVFGKEIDAYVITRVLSSFEKTLVSTNSVFDDFKRSNFQKGLNTNERNGWRLFSEDLKCIKCHQLPHFTNYQIELNGLSLGDDKDLGRYRITGLESDKWKFKVPSLRNVEITAPYLHDGSYSSLNDLIDAYLSSKNSPVYFLSNKKNQLRDRNDLVSFLKTLTEK